MKNVETARQKLIDWRNNVSQFAYECFKFKPDAWQRKVFEAFPSMDADKQRISLQACAGPGKTAVLAICGWNFLTCYGDRDNHPKGAAVSVTQDNLKDNLWPEFSNWQNRSEFHRAAFTWTKERIFSKEHPETWFISARSWSKAANPEEQGRTLSGLHSKFILALVDESGDIPLTVLKAGEQALATGPSFGKIIIAGNPTSLDGLLYAASTKLRKMFLIVRITGDPADPDRSPRIDKAWAQAQIDQYGRDDPWIKSYILGQFPEASIDALIGVEEVEAAMNRHLTEDKYSWSQKRLGIDAARFGDDKWVIFPRQGLAAFKPVEMRHVRSQEVATRVIAAKIKWKSEREYFDDGGGYASGAIDAMISSGYSPVPINFASKAIDPRFFNKRAEMLWTCAQWVKRGGALPRVPDLVDEMVKHTYTFKGGKLIIIDKEQVKALLGRSPNYFDALSLTHAEPDMPNEVDALLSALQRNSRSAEHEFDPFRDTSSAQARHEFDPLRESI